MKALTAGALLALHREDFDSLLGSLSHIRHMWRFEALRKVTHTSAYLGQCLIFLECTFKLRLVFISPGGRIDVSIHPFIIPWRRGLLQLGITPIPDASQFL